MLLPWKKNVLEARPRSTPPDATLRALDDAPPPPTGILKVDSHLDNGQAGHRRKNLKLRLLALRNVKVILTTPDSPVGSIIACERVPSSAPTSEGLEDSIGAHFVGTLPDHTAAAEGAFLQTPPDASRLESIPHPVAFPSSAPLVADAASHDLSALATTSKAIQPNLSNISQPKPAHALSTTLSSTSCSKIPLPLKFIGPECYIALDTSVEEKLQLKSNPLLQKKLRSFLKSLKLKDPAVVIDCVAASTTPERSKLKATILFLCLDSDQQKIISSSLRQLNSKDLEVVPLADYQYAVLVQDTRFCSSDCGFPSCPGSLSGREVEATFHNGLSLGQALCKLSDASVDSRCTLGGLVVFGGSAYALTTSHAFLGRSATFQPAQESEMGNIHSYNFTGTSNLSLKLSDEKDAASVCTYDQDWALIRVRSYLYGLNTFKPPGTTDIISVEGFASGDELLHGAVHVITASSGIREGYLSSSFAYWEIGSSCFEVRTVFMENPLHDGDSGSWVIVQGKLCGYIISRVVGKPWGYMLPIQPVIEDICKNLALDTESVKVISRTLLDELQQGKRVATGLSGFDDATFNHQSGTHHVQLGSPPSATAPLTPVLPSSETFRQLPQELVTIRKESRVLQWGRNLISPQFGTPTTTFNEEAYVYHQGIRLGLIVLALWISVFITNADTYMVATAIPQITNYFGSLEDIGWYASAYLLAVASCRTSCKRLYAFFPIKWMFVLYVFIFGVGNLICGTARSSTVLIIGRAVAGAGSAGVFPGFGIIITHCMPPRKQALHDGYLGVIYAIAAITGPIIGGALTSNVSWRWCFYINSLAASVAIILIVCCLKLQTVATENWKDRARGIDILGLVVLMPAIVCLLLALQWGGTRDPWASSKIIALLALFGVLSCCYAIVQGMKVKHSTIISAILRERSLLATAWFSFGLGSSISMVTYYLPIWFQVVKGVSALKSGIMNLPLILTIVIASTLSILIVLRSRYYAPLMLISSILSATGFGMLSTLTLESRFGAWVGYQVLAGFGIGLGIPMSFTVTKLVSDPNVASAAISVCLFMQATGGAVFVSVGLNIFINKFVTSLGVHSADLAAVLSSGLTNFGTATGSPDDVKLVNSNSLAYSFIAAAAIAAASVFGSLIVGWKSLMLARAQYND
ncbi:hypothetical protein ACMFMG_009105 [Clarireedia jacksonii]